MDRFALSVQAARASLNFANSARLSAARQRGLRPKGLQRRAAPFAPQGGDFSSAAPII